MIVERHTHTGRAKRGSLKDAVLVAYKITTNPDEIGKLVGAKRYRVCRKLQELNLPFEFRSPSPLTWTPELKRALLDDVLAKKSVQAIANRLGVHPKTLVRGLCEIIRESRV